MVEFVKVLVINKNGDVLADTYVLAPFVADGNFADKIIDAIDRKFECGDSVLELQALEALAND